MRTHEQAHKGWRNVYWSFTRILDPCKVGVLAQQRAQSRGLLPLSAGAGPAGMKKRTWKGWGHRWSWAAAAPGIQAAACQGREVSAPCSALPSLPSQNESIA